MMFNISGASVRGALRPGSGPEQRRALFPRCVLRTERSRDRPSGPRAHPDRDCELACGSDSRPSAGTSERTTHDTHDR